MRECRKEDKLLSVTFIIQQDQEMLVNSKILLQKRETSNEMMFSPTCALKESKNIKRACTVERDACLLKHTYYRERWVPAVIEIYLHFYFTVYEGDSNMMISQIAHQADELQVFWLLGLTFWVFCVNEIIEIVKIGPGSLCLLVFNLGGNAFWAAEDFLGFFVTRKNWLKSWEVALYQLPKRIPRASLLLFHYSFP